jgi:hypothetical protein
MLTFDIANPDGTVNLEAKKKKDALEAVRLYED